MSCSHRDTGGVGSVYPALIGTLGGRECISCSHRDTGGRECISCSHRDTGG